MLEQRENNPSVACNILHLKNFNFCQEQEANVKIEELIEYVTEVNSLPKKILENGYWYVYGWNGAHDMIRPVVWSDSIIFKNILSY